MNKTSGGDGITVELFQILKDDAVKVLMSRGSAVEYQADERAGVARLRWRVSGR